MGRMAHTLESGPALAGSLPGRFTSAPGCSPDLQAIFTYFS